MSSKCALFEKVPVKFNRENTGSGVSFMEELMAKISLRNISTSSSAENVRVPRQFPTATPNPIPNTQYIKPQTSKLSRNLTNSTSKLSLAHFASTMDGQRWSGSGSGSRGSNRDTGLGPWSGGSGNFKSSDSFAAMNDNKHTLPPLKHICGIPVRSSNNFSKLNVGQAEYRLPYINNVVPNFLEPLPTAMPDFMDSNSNNYSQRFRSPRGQWQSSVTRRSRPSTYSKQGYLREFSKEKDDFHLPPITLNAHEVGYPKLDRSMTSLSNSRPNTVYNESTPPVSEFIKLFEHKVPDHRSHRPEFNKMNTKTKDCARKFWESIEDDEEPLAIHPEDGCPTRNVKIRRMLQKFDHSAAPYERTSTVDGSPDFDEFDEMMMRIPETGQRSRSFHALQTTSKENTSENRNIDRSSLIRVTKFKAAKPVKKSSKSRLRRKETFENVSKASLLNEVFSSPSLNSSDLQELQERSSDELSKIIKPPWVRHSIEAGSEVQASVCKTWDSVNFQVRSKLNSVFSDTEDFQEDCVQIE